MWAMTVPEALNSASVPVPVVAPRRKVTVSPVQSVIWDATVRCQMSS